MKDNPYLKETTLLDYTHPMIDKLLLVRQWAELTEHDRIGAVYDFVQNEIALLIRNGSLHNLPIYLMTTVLASIYWRGLIPPLGV